MALPLLSLVPALIDLVPEAIGYFTKDDKKEEAVRDIVKIAKDVGGFSKDTPSEDVISAIKADPNLALEFQKAVMADKHRLDEMYLDDRKDAREMYTDTEHDQADKIADHIIKWNLPYVVGVLVFQILILTIVPIWFSIDPAVSGIVGNVCGWVIKGLLDERIAVTGFFFGSSLGSKLKDKKDKN